MPQISVIIPVYRVEKTLRRCVDSVLAQTFGDYEVILVDDGSPDNCGAICDEYDRFENVTVIHKKNGGLSDARNAGLDKARGEYVMFLDSDDYLTYDCLETLCGHDADMVIGTIKYDDNSGVFSDQPKRNDEMLEPRDFAAKLSELLEEKRLNYIHAKLYRRSIITEHHLCFEDDMLTSAEDTVFNFTFLPYCRRIYISARPVHYYVYTPGGLGKRFYPDRYERYCRLNGYLIRICRQMGIYNEEMEAVIDRRRASSGVYSMEGIIAQTDLDRHQKAALLDRIAGDTDLRKIAEKVEVRGSGELRFLLKKGGRRYILHEYYVSLKNIVFKKFR